MPVTCIVTADPWTTRTEGQHSSSNRAQGRNTSHPSASTRAGAACVPPPPRRYRRRRPPPSVATVPRPPAAAQPPRGRPTEQPLRRARWREAGRAAPVNADEAPSGASNCGKRGAKAAAESVRTRVGLERLREGCVAGGGMCGGGSGGCLVVCSVSGHRADASTTAFIAVPSCGARVRTQSADGRVVGARPATRAR